jgi:hypothetical protein
MWYLTISKELIRLGFQVCSVDKCLFIDLANEVFVYFTLMICLFLRRTTVTLTEYSLETKFGKMK